MKKMLLVDPNESWQRYRLLLDQEIQKVLSRSDLSEDEKLYQYLSLLKRFISSKDQQQKHKNVHVQTDYTGAEPLFQQLAPVLNEGENGFLPKQSHSIEKKEKGVHTVQPPGIERSSQTDLIDDIAGRAPSRIESEIFDAAPRFTRSQSVSDERPIRQSLDPIEKGRFNTEKVVANIFHEYRDNANLIIKKMHDKEMQSKIDFNPDTGELLISGKTIPGSNIVEHLKYLLYSRPGTKPQFFDRFIEEIKKLKIPDHIIGNQARTVWQQQKGSGLRWI